MIAAVAAVSAVNAADPSIGGDIGISSKYVWRGLAFNEDRVFWPDVWASWNGITVTGFLSMDMTDKNTAVYGHNYQSEVTDGDIYLDYTRAFGKINGSIGVNQYFFPGYGKDTVLYKDDYGPVTEPYLKVGVPISHVCPSLVVDLDVPDKNVKNGLGKATGAYISPKISWSKPIGCATPTIAMSIGYATKAHNSFFALVDDAAGFQDFTTTLQTVIAPPAPLADYATLTLSCNYSYLLNKKLRDAGYDDGHFWAGITVNMFRTITCSKGDAK